MRDTWVNWGKNQRCTPDRIAHPSNTDEVAELVCLGVAKRKKVRAVGAGHSFTRLCPTDGIMIDLSGFDSILQVNQERMHVTVGAGIRLFELNKRLEEHG
ncbi:MAG: FAD-binding protein, partial [Actinomycetota bacterium]|nr:FAD-binding protein [Actinomycetota bacterium]